MKQQICLTRLTCKSPKWWFSSNNRRHIERGCFSRVLLCNIIISQALNCWWMKFNFNSTNYFSGNSLNSIENQLNSGLQLPFKSLFTLSSRFFDFIRKHTRTQNQKREKRKKVKIIEHENVNSTSLPCLNPRPVFIIFFQRFFHGKTCGIAWVCREKCEKYPIDHSEALKSIKVVTLWRPDGKAAAEQHSAKKES